MTQSEVKNRQPRMAIIPYVVENKGFNVLSAAVVMGDQQNWVSNTDVALEQAVPPISTRSELLK